MLKIKNRNNLKRNELINSICTFNSTDGIERTLAEFKSYCKSHGICRKKVINDYHTLRIIQEVDPNYSDFTLKPMNGKQYFRFLKAEIKKQKTVDNSETESSSESDTETHSSESEENF